MLIQIAHFTITLIMIFTTIYCCGLGVLKKIKFEGDQDFFLKILVGYTFIGIVSVIFHFFFKIDNFFSISIVLISSISFFIFFFKDYKKEYFIFIFIFILISPFLFAYSDHPIDSNMYHHPYLSYLKAEKIIFAIANIQFRFGHISLLQYVQATLINDYFHDIALSSINILFYLSFIFFVSQKIFLQKNINYSFLLTILISSFILIKFARYREYGNDLIPLLVCIYFLIRIVDEINKKTKLSDNAPNLFLFFFSLMFVHKISYIFASLIFITLLDFKKFKFLKQIRLSYFFFTLVLLFPWLVKNYIETSCLIYPIEITCFSNSFYHLHGKADPSSAAWLTEIWAKGFIDHPEWRSLDLQNYAKEFNWVPVWLSGHFLKILEIIAPLIFLIFIVTIYMFINKKKIFFKNSLNNINKKYYILLFTIFCGFFVWFYKAPVFRYGSFYIISFITISYLLMLNYFFKLKKISNVIFFKKIFLICIIFFVTKNIIRIHNSSNDFFPKTINTELDIKNINGLNLSRSNSKLSSLCYYTDTICSHELPAGIKVKKLKNYYVIE
jgi:hypothetical protein